MPTFGFTGLGVALSELTNWQRELSIASRLEEHGQSIEDRAKAKIGHYQSAVGPFKAWDELADATKRKKSPRGLENAPLLWDDNLRQDIEHRVQSIGSAEIGVWIGIPDGAPSSAYARRQELGDTSEGPGSIPARPFLAPSIYEDEADFKQEMRDVVAQWAARAARRDALRSRLADV
jgi:hypothetical protein